MNRLRAALLRLEEPIAARSEGELPQQDTSIPIFRRRGMSYTSTPSRIQQRVILDTPDEAYAFILAKQAEYLHRSDAPLFLPLFRIQPGTGKTTQTITTIENTVRQFNVHAGFAGPRTGFYASDILPKSTMPEEWQRWYKHQGYNPDKPEELETCKWEHDIDSWLSKGHEPYDFCKIADTCGDRYYNQDCVYADQKHNRAKITYLQHQHVTLGNPKIKNMAFLAGDEMPLGAFLHQWSIPLSAVIPLGMDARSPFTQLLKNLRDLAQRDTLIEGQKLYTLLGGPQYVHDVASNFQFDVNASYNSPFATNTDEARDVPYKHLRILQELLIRESGRMKDDLEFIPRIILYNDSLVLLLRKELHPDLIDKPIIWLDGTGHPHLYEAMFRREVETIDIALKPLGNLYQLWTKANGQTVLFDKEEPVPSLNMANEPPVLESEDEVPITSKRLEEVKLAILWIIAKKGYSKVGIITFKKCITFFEDVPNVITGYFYAERGSNKFVGCDVVFVVGTPLPSLQAIQLDARMLFFERDEPFQKEWSVKPVPYVYMDTEGRTAHNDVSGYWNDKDLQTLVEVYRENEIEQSAERSRRSTRYCDVWLFTNIPNDNLVPTRLLTEKELFNCPKDTDPYTWARVVLLSDECFENEKPFTVLDIRKATGVSISTGNKYWDAIAELQAERWDVVSALVPKQKGRKPKALYPAKNNMPVEE